MMIETTTGNMNNNCKQIQKNFNVVDNDGVIKHNLSSIWKDKRNKQIKIIKILMMFVHRELQTNAENSNQDDDGTINLIKTRNT